MRFFDFDSPFAKGVNKLVMMIYGGVLWFLCSIPIITSGAATVALYEVFLKMVKNQEGYIGSSFFKAFRENLKQGIKVWGPILLMEIVFSFNIFYYGVLGGGQFKVQTILFIVLLVMLRAVAAYVFAIMAKFENTLGNHIRMALVLAIRNFGWSLVIVAVQVAMLFLVWFFVYIPLLFIMGFAGYIQAVIFDHIFQGLIDRGMIIEQN